MKQERTASARLLAPIAVAVVAIVVLIVIVTSIGGSGSDDGRGRGGGGGSAKAKRTGEKVYVVEPGDSLTRISRRTGVPVDKLTQLNPDLDPQALISGQRVKLR